MSTMTGLLKSLPLLITVSCVYFKGGEALTTQCYMSDSVAVLGNHSFTLSCAYNKGTDEKLRSISLLRKRHHDTYQKIVTVSETSSSLLDDALKSRTTITSPTPHSSKVSVKFTHIICTDKGDYKWLTEYSTNGLLLTATATTSVIIKAVTTFDESAPPLAVPNSNLEEGDEVTFACEGDVGNLPIGSITFFFRYKHAEARWISMASEERTTNPIYQTYTCSYRQTATLKMKLIREMNGMIVRCVVQQDTVDEVGDKHRDTTQINVQYPPENATIFSSSDTNHGSDSLSLVCNSDSNPAPAYRWFIHHKNITVKGSLLVIPNITVSDSGKKYTCFVRNIINGQIHEISKDSYLNVLSPPPVSASPNIDTPENEKYQIIEHYLAFIILITAAVVVLTVLMVRVFAVYI